MMTTPCLVSPRRPSSLRLRDRFHAALLLAGVALLGTAGCEDKAATEERAKFIKIMADGADKICACKTMECLEKANKAIQDAKNPTTAPTPEEQKQLDAATTKLKDCTEKVA